MFIIFGIQEMLFEHISDVCNPVNYVWAKVFIGRIAENHLQLLQFSESSTLDFTQIKASPGWEFSAEAVNGAFEFVESNLHFNWHPIWFPDGYEALFDIEPTVERAIRDIWVVPVQ